MSYFEDFIEPHIGEIPEYLMNRHYYLKDNVWVTKDGHEIKINKMTDNHLINSYNMIKQGRLERKEFLPLLEKELLSRNIHIV